MPARRIFITLPESLVAQVEEYNEKHPSAPISYSGACKQAIETLLAAQPQGHGASSEEKEE